MRSAAANRAERLYAAFGRLVLIFIGVFAVLWGIITFRTFWRDTSLDLTADQILNGERFKSEILQNLLASADSAERTWPRPEALRSAAVIRLRLAEQTSQTEGSKSLGPLFEKFDVAGSVERSLSAAPADPFLWLALFRLQSMKGDLNKEDFAYLRMSYLVGPHEGWVAVKRNYIALGIFPELPQDLSEMAVTEFKNLVVSAYYDSAVKILAGPGWPIRDRLLHSLEDAPDKARRDFARSADRLGCEITVPGVERAEPRPWR
jgi:hypothetical protein